MPEGSLWEQVSTFSKHISTNNKMCLFCFHNLLTLHELAHDTLHFSLHKICLKLQQTFGVIVGATGVNFFVYLRVATTNNTGQNNCLQLTCKNRYIWFQAASWLNHQSASIFLANPSKRWWCHYSTLHCAINIYFMMIHRPKNLSTLWEIWMYPINVIQMFHSVQFSRLENKH